MSLRLGGTNPIYITKHNIKVLDSLGCDLKNLNILTVRTM